MADDTLSARPCTRSYALDDLHVRQDGDGRVVEAYAAVFAQRTEIVDMDGHYREELAPTSFNRTIRAKMQPGKPAGFQVLFNHGAAIDGRASGDLTLPIGVPLEVQADERGVFTRTRYIDNPLADSVLSAIRQGAIRAQSFSGRFLKSARSFPEGRGRGNLPLVVRSEIDMREYGPTVFPAYEGAAILGTRAETFLSQLLAQPPEARLEWLQRFEGQFEGFGTQNQTGSDPLDSIGTRNSRPAGTVTLDMRDKIRQWREKVNSQ